VNPSTFEQGDDFAGIPPGTYTLSFAVLNPNVHPTFKPMTISLKAGEVLTLKVGVELG
jgi:hypothetical protein